LDFSAPKTKQAKEALREVKHIMETTIELQVPILADHKSGKNWGECK
jgi:DNA polymerase I-like protein with 3'-5' exonuclease and polymerase domains